MDGIKQNDYEQLFMTFIYYVSIHTRIGTRKKYPLTNTDNIFFNKSH